jgi:hypothetical protein
MPTPARSRRPVRSTNGAENSSSCCRRIRHCSRQRSVVHISWNCTRAPGTRRSPESSGSSPGVKMRCVVANSGPILDLRHLPLATVSDSPRRQSKLRQPERTRVSWKSPDALVLEPDRVCADPALSVSGANTVSFAALSDTHVGRTFTGSETRSGSWRPFRPRLATPALPSSSRCRCPRG